MVTSGRMISVVIATSEKEMELSTESIRRLSDSMYARMPKATMSMKAIS